MYEINLDLVRGGTLQADLGEVMLELWESYITRKQMVQKFAERTGLSEKTGYRVLSELENKGRIYVLHKQVIDKKRLSEAERTPFQKALNLVNTLYESEKVSKPTVVSHMEDFGLARRTVYRKLSRMERIGEIEVWREGKGRAPTVYQF